MERITVAQARTEAAIGKEVQLQGWVRTRRDSKGGFSFLELNDGSSMGNVQILAEASLANYETDVKKLGTGASVTVLGSVRKSPAKGQATEVQAPTDHRPWPGRPRDLSRAEEGRIRSSFCARLPICGRVPIRSAPLPGCATAFANPSTTFFRNRAFSTFTRLIITASDCEGAGEMFKVTTLDLNKLPPTGPDYSHDFFHKPAYLTVSGQLQAEIFACGLGKVYTFGPTFRAENSNTARHLAEFWMIEPEMAFYDLQDNMTLAEAFIKRIIKDALTRCGEDMKFFQERIDKDMLTRLEGIASSQFLRLPYTEAVDILQKSGQTFEFPVDWGVDLQSEHERFLTEQEFKKPVILFDYPRTLKPFYMRVNDDGKTVRAMDVLVPGVGEIIGGSQREERLDVLEQRMKEQGLDPATYWWYLDLRRYGTVPHAGFGLGLERTLLFLTGMANIRDVIPFPRTPGSAEF